MSKKHTRIFIIILALTLTAVSGTTGLAAAENFTVQQSYTENIFTDIKTTDWYYQDIVQGYEYGFISASADKLFRPNEDMSIAALLALSCRIRAAYDGEAAPQNGTELWYLPYIEYAVSKQIIAAGEFTNSYSRAATRAEAAHILAQTLPEAELATINQVEYLPDVEQDHIYSKDILTLYQAGVISGSDAQRNFFPDEKIQRAGVIAMAARLTDSSKRVSFSLTGNGNISANFSKKREYASEIFTDISPADWYYQDIVKLYTYGLAEGMGENMFMPKGEINIASVIVLACRLHSTYYGMQTPQNGDMVWYLPYVQYAIGAGIISANDFSGRYTQAATRGEVAYILGRTLPAEVMQTLNSVSYLPDVASTHPYYAAILYLYNRGIVTGKNAAGDFYPDDNITRAEVMTMMTRLIELRSRKLTKTVQPQTEQELIAELLRLVNLHRTKAGLQSVSSFDEINQAAQTRAVEIAEKREHIRPDGTDFFTVLDEYAVEFSRTAENIGCGQTNAIDSISAWMTSPEHKKIILDPEFTTVGIGHHITSYGMHCWALIFAVK